jgi:ribonuclease/clavin/mitogillin
MNFIFSRRVLIDASGSTDNIMEYVTLLKKELEKQKCALQEILITHWHPDHTEGVQPILKTIIKGDLKVSKYKLEPTEYDTDTKYNYIDEGEIIRTEGATLKAFFTPGHARDHLVFYLEEENSLFSGDCILGETTAKFEDLTQYMSSLNKMLNIKPLVIYPGHGPVVQNACERIQLYIEHRNKRNVQILAALKDHYNHPLTPMDLVKIIYPAVNSNAF